MKPQLCLAFILLARVITATAQDTIVTVTGERIPAKVTRISSTSVEYKKLSNPDGPSYVQDRSEITAIHYPNGTADVFSEATASAATAGADEYYQPSAAPPATSFSRTDIKKKAQLIFYGIDFTSFTLVEPRRMKEAQTIASVDFPAWNEYFAKEVNEKTMMRWLHKGDISFNTKVTAELNKTADPAGVVASTIPARDMNAMIAKQVRASANGDSRNDGIGFVINVEYFDKKTEETSAYFTFFDIATRTVICSEHVKVRKVEGSGLVNFWGAGLYAAMKKFVDTDYKKY